MRLVSVLLVVAACGRPEAPLAEADCKEIAAKLAKLAAAGTEVVVAETSRPSWVESCKKRYTRASLACIRGAEAADRLVACPENDLRPPEERPEAADCDKLAAHVRELVEATSGG